MKFQIFLCLFFTLYHSSYATNVQILDKESRESIESVNVFSGNQGITTNFEGFCNLGIFNNDQIITFSSIGYKLLKIKKVNVDKNIYLERENLSMDMIHVISSKKGEKRKYNRLESDLRIVLPYAKKTAKLINRYTPELQKINEYSFYRRYFEKKRVFKSIEHDLIKTYGNKIRKLKRRQGRLLIRLIDRETDKTSFTIIKEFRNILSASFWQVTARIFGHNLKSSYNPEIGNDRFIEYFIRKIERN